jgi:acyl-CoA synthetase (AMP-forming)/AMP-acid ligase II
MTALSHVEGLAFDTGAVERLTATLARHAAIRGMETALLLDGHRVTFAELEIRTRTAQALLRESGVGPGERFAWCGANHPDFFAAMLAAMRIGAVLVPVNWRQKSREIAYILADSGTKLVVADEAFLPTIVEAAGQAIALIETADFSRRLDMGGADDAVIGGDPEAAALLLYTSGTTGSPKGVQLSETAISVGREMEELTGGFDDWTVHEVLLSPLPLFHIGGICWAMCGLMRGCAVVLTNNPAPAALLDLCLAESVSRTFMVPQLVRGLIEEMAARKVRPEALKGIHYGAAPMDAPLLERGLLEIGCRFLQYFGMTEMAGTISILPPSAHDPAHPQLLRSVGKVLPGSAIEIRDPQGNVLPVGEAGEIWTRGPTMMLGYANRPEQTAEAVVDGWYRTGDGGRLDDDGFLYLTDRIKDMIVTGGENVYPVEVEAVLREHPAVADCAVFGLPDAHWGERVCAAVELRHGAEFDAEAIIAFVKGQIAGYKAPRQVDQVEALPRTASGKVQRGKLRQSMLEKSDAAY